MDNKLAYEMVRVARLYPHLDEWGCEQAAACRIARQENPPRDGRYVPVSPAGLWATGDAPLLGWKTLERLGVVNPVIQAARDLAAKKIGFSEFKRIVRENS